MATLYVAAVPRVSLLVPSRTGPENAGTESLLDMWSSQWFVSVFWTAAVLNGRPPPTAPAQASAPAQAVVVVVLVAPGGGSVARMWSHPPDTVASRHSAAGPLSEPNGTLTTSPGVVAVAVGDGGEVRVLAGPDHVPDHIRGSYEDTLFPSMLEGNSVQSGPESPKTTASTPLASPAPPPPPEDGDDSSELSNDIR